jgi:hypothetical protein
LVAGNGGQWGTWTGNGAFTPLPFPSGFPTQINGLGDDRMAINASGTAVGTALVTVTPPGQASTNYDTAIMVTAAGASYLFDPAAGYSSDAIDINDDGVIVGGQATVGGHNFSFGSAPYKAFVRPRTAPSRSSTSPARLS